MSRMHLAKTDVDRIYIDPEKKAVVLSNWKVTNLLAPIKKTWSQEETVLH